MAERKEKRGVSQEDVVEGVSFGGGAGAPGHLAPPASLPPKARAEKPLTWFHLWLELGKEIESKTKICACAGYYSVRRGQAVRGLPVCQCTDRRKRALLALKQTKQIIDRDWE